MILVLDFLIKSCSDFEEIMKIFQELFFKNKLFCAGFGTGTSWLRFFLEKLMLLEFFQSDIFEITIWFEISSRFIIKILF